MTLQMRDLAMWRRTSHPIEHSGIGVLSRTLSTRTRFSRWSSTGANRERPTCRKIEDTFRQRRFQTRGQFCFARDYSAFGAFAPKFAVLPIIVIRSCRWRIIIEQLQVMRAHEVLPEKYAFVASTFKLRDHSSIRAIQKGCHEEWKRFGQYRVMILDGHKMANLTLIEVN